MLSIFTSEVVPSMLIIFASTEENFTSPVSLTAFIFSEVAFLIVILLFVLLVKSLLNINRPNSYSIDSRIEKVAEKKASLKTDANYDVVGWVRVQGTKIDFPVVSGKDRSFKSPVETTGYGWLTTYGDTKYHNVLNIYGHNIMNLGREPLISDESFERFEELLAFTDYDFAKKNQYFQYTMDGKDNLYKIFAVSILDSTSLVGLPEDDYDDGELSRYVKMIKEGLQLVPGTTIIPFSAETKQGREEIWELMDSYVLGETEVK